MPTYVYKRSDGAVFEQVQKITAEPLKVCPKTGLPVKRIIQPVATHFRGGGWYATDYKGK